MALTRPGGYIRAAAPTVTFLNGKGYWTQNQITQYQTQRKWPQEFSVVLVIPQQSLVPLVYAWDGSNLAYSTYTSPTTNAYRGAVWDRTGRAIFYAPSSSTIKGYEFTKAGGFGTEYTGGTFTYTPQTSTLRASPNTDRLWYWSAGSDGRLCSISYDPATKTFGTATQAVYLNAYPYSGDKRPNISPDGNFYGNGDSGTTGVVRLYAISSDGSSPGSITTPSSISSTSSYVYNVAWSPSGAAIGMGLTSGNPRFKIFRWNASTYYGAEYSYSNFTGPLAATNKVFWNNAGNVIFFLTNTAPYLQAYQWDDTNGIGSRFADPSNSFTWNFATTADVMISPDDKLLVFNTLSSSGGSEIAIAWDNTTGFGTITSMPINSANANAVAFGTITT
jgi:hypothetical protein